MELTSDSSTYCWKERSEKNMKKLLIVGLILALCVLSGPVTATIGYVASYPGSTTTTTLVYLVWSLQQVMS